MKVNYLAAVDRQKDIGVYNKIEAQIKSFNNAGFPTKLVRMNIHFHNHFGGKIVDATYNWNTLNIKKDVDALYIRFPKASWGFLKFLSNFKKEKKGRKVVIEIPTFPYKGEESLTVLPILIKDRIFRLFLKKYIDRIATFSTDKKIFGIKTIQIQNGVDFSCIKEKKSDKKQLDEIHMIAVATMQPWHGYDRLIIGMGNYYQSGGSRPIYLHLVGTGPEINRYQNLVNKYKLQLNVIFYGKKTGEELNQIYNKCDIGVLSLGNFRKGLILSSELKSKEYLAKGLSMVGSGKFDISLGNKCPYISLFPEDENAIDIHKLIAYYNDIYVNSKQERVNIIHKIRSQAEQVCDINVTMKPVIKYLQRNANRERKIHSKVEKEEISRLFVVKLIDVCAWLSHFVHFHVNRK